MKFVPAKTQRREFAASALLKIRHDFLQEPKNRPAPIVLLRNGGHHGAREKSVC